MRVLHAVQEQRVSRYASHVRDVLALLRALCGELENTARLVRGVDKAGGSAVRPCVWASASQTRDLSKWATDAGRRDLALSWAISRHFCPRFSETLALGTALAPFRFLGSGVGSEAIVTFVRRKCYRQAVDVTRRCVCGGRWAKRLTTSPAAVRQWPPRKRSACPTAHEDVRARSPSRCATPQTAAESPARSASANCSLRRAQRRRRCCHESLCGRRADSFKLAVTPPLR